MNRSNLLTFLIALALFGVVVIGVGGGCRQVQQPGSEGDVSSPPENIEDGGGTDTDNDTSFCAGEGTWYDHESSLCWEDPQSAFHEEWIKARDYCNELVLAGYDDWRLPMIQELIALIRGCGSSECPVSDPDNLSEVASYPEECDPCDYMEGPGLDGCYWDSELNGECDIYWSSSACLPNWEKDKWSTSFRSGTVGLHYETDYNRARCVRGGP